MSILHRDNNNGTIVFVPTLLEHIRLKNHVEIQSMLQEVNPCQLKDTYGNTLLHFAAEYGNDEFARYLIDLGAEVDAQNHLRETPLMLAINANDAATVRVLLEANANIFVANVRGQCSLGMTFKANASIAEDIFAAVLQKVTIESLKASEYVASNEFHRDCPLYHFILLDNAEMTRVLLQKGSPINARIPGSSVSALHEAVRSNCLENVRLLIDYGADVNAEDQKGQTPLDHVSFLELQHENSLLAVIEVLVDAGARFFEPRSRRLIVARILELGTREMVRSVLRRPLDLHLHDRDNKTPLHYLARNKQAYILEELRHFHFDMNVRDQDRRTMLHHAALVGNASSVKFLLDRGADLNAQDSRGKTPLFFVADPSITWKHDNRYNDHANCVEILLDYGADPHTFIVENSLVMRINYRLISDQVIRPIFAKLVLLESCGQPINIFVRNWIKSFVRFERILDSVTLQLENMKQIEVDGSMTLFDFMVTNKLSRFARSRRIISSLTRIIEDFNATSSYRYMLNQRFLKFNRVVERRNEFVLVINEVLTKFSDLSVSSIAEKIVDYLELDEQ